MKSFKEFTQPNPRYKWFSFTVDEYDIHILFDSTCLMLTEAQRKGLPIGGQYSAQLHKAHTPGGKQHLHVYAKNNQLFALNMDGSAHDASHGTKIPNKVAKGIQNKFPEFTLPPNNVIESAPAFISLVVRSQLLLG